jgi:hypothetical protein
LVRYDQHEYKFYVMLVLFVILLAMALGLKPRVHSGRARGGMLNALSNNEMEQTARDLTGHALWVRFDGLGVEGMEFSMELQNKFKVLYGRGLTAYEPGFWRVVKYEDGKESVEATHPVPPEYMFFFELEEKNILWRGDLDMERRRVENGQCITNKKRFGFIPYQETLATWTADVILPGEALPTVALPKLSAQQFNPPADFLSPLDMERYPQSFSSEFRRYFFAVEEALSKGKSPPRRPKPFFTPGSSSSGKDGDEDRIAAQKQVEELESLPASRREIRTTPRDAGRGGGKGF